MEKYITVFHVNFYIPSTQNISFHLPHVRILGTHHCGKEPNEDFKCGGHCKTFYFSVIIQSRWLSVFLTKPNMNIMVAMYKYLLKSLHYITLVLHTRLLHFCHHAIFHLMIFFNRFFLMKSNSIIPLHLQTLRALLNH